MNTVLISHISLAAMSTLIDQLRQQVAENPYEYQNWENLLREVGKGPRSEEQIVALREVYENIVAIFPTTVRRLLAIIYTCCISLSHIPCLIAHAVCILEGLL